MLSNWLLESLRESTTHPDQPCLGHVNVDLRRFVDFAMHRVRMLTHFGVTPFLVFDGDQLPSKRATEDERAARRRESRRLGLELLQDGKANLAYQELQKAIDVTPEMARMLVDELERSSYRFLVAPYEADAQLAFLEAQGYIDAVISEDSDLLVFGTKCLLTKLDQFGDCLVINRDDFTACREVNLHGWTTTELRRMAILSGCDYLAGLPKMGLKTAYRLVRRAKSLDAIIRLARNESKFRVPSNYAESFERAENTFLHQRVFCPEQQMLVYLNPPSSAAEFENVAYVGPYVEPGIARKVAQGRLNPMTKEPLTIGRAGSDRQRSLIYGRNSETLESNKNRSIESFFKPKPKREPLAELDPNLFQPSESQRQLLDAQERPRTWNAEFASGDAENGQNQERSLREMSLQNWANASSARPPKRQRLCAEPISLSEQDCVERSKFFSTPAKSDDRNLNKIPQKATRKHEFELWSDDSVEAAMSQLVESERHMTSRRSSRLKVYRDPSPTEGVTEAEHHQNQIPSRKSAELLATPTSVGDISAFSYGLQTQLRASCGRSRGARKCRDSSDAGTLDVDEHDASEVEPQEPRKACEVSHKSGDPDADLKTSPTIPQSSVMIEESPSVPADGQRTTRNLSSKPEVNLTPSRTVSKALFKGSEDVVVFESEAESETSNNENESDLNTPTSPTIPRRNYGEVKNDKRKPSLDLQRFAFNPPASLR